MNTTTSIKNGLIATALAAGLAMGLTLTASPAMAQTPTTITYQGVLNKNGSAVTEEIEIAFLLFDSAVAGNLVGGPIFRTLTPEDGVFTEALDFGEAAFAANQPLWLEMQVSSIATPADMDTFRQPLTATPFAVNTRGINVLSDGRVGIGTDAPSTALEISRNEAELLTLSSVGGGQSSQMAYAATGGRWVTGTNHLGSGTANNQYFVRDEITGSTPFTIQRGTGRVGIGTTTPLTRLDVSGEISLGSTGAFEQGLHIEASTGDWEIGTNSFGNGTSGNQFYIYDDMTNRYMMTVQRGTGRVGIGTIQPERMLHLRNTGEARIRLEADTDNSDETDHPSIEFSQDADQVRAFIGMEGGQNDFVIRTEGNQTNPDISLMAEGNVGINTLIPAFNLHVNGSAAKPGGGSWTNTSDIRLKKNITPIDDALGTILSLRGVHFEYKDPAAINELAGIRTGFIAQEAERVIPDWIFEVDGYKRMTIRGFEALAVEAMRELKAENDMLRERLDMIEALLLTEKSRD